MPDSIPREIGGWTHDPDPYNGRAWFGDRGRVSVLVSSGVGGSAYAKVRDERVSGSYVFITGEGEELSFEEALEIAVDWMETHRPEEWTHPRIEPAVFDVPEGFELDHYGLGRQQVTVRYSAMAVPEHLYQLNIKITGYDSTDNWTLSIERHPKTHGHEEDLWDPEKGTTFLEVLTRTRRLCGAVRQHPTAVTQQENGELDLEGLLSASPVPDPPEAGQHEIFHYVGDQP